MGLMCNNAESNETLEPEENFWDVLDKAQNAILRRYPDRNSIAQIMALKELEEIAAGNHSEPEKIREIRSKFPFIQSSASDASDAQESAPADANDPESVSGEDAYGKGLLAYENEHYRDAFNCFLEAAKRGNIKAQWRLAECYEDGNGVPRNPSEAAKWYQKLADEGDAEAQYRLAVSYPVRGPEGKTVVFELMHNAAEHGNVKAQMCLGSYYAKGYGVKKDMVKALKWFQRLAEQGVTEAQCCLGWIYEQGSDEAPRNPETAVKWYGKAAEQGLAEAQFRLGYCYTRNLGVPADKTKAFQWYRKAAEQKHAKALHNLGVCYWHGDGVARDITYNGIYTNEAEKLDEELCFVSDADYCEPDDKDMNRLFPRQLGNEE